MRTWLVLGVVSAVAGRSAWGQSSSSLFRRSAADTPGLSIRPAAATDEAKSTPYTRASYFSVKPLPQREFKVNDLVTVVVREKSTYKIKGKTDLERQITYKGELKDIITWHGGKFLPVPASQPGGDPKLDFTLDRSLKGDGSSDRSDEVVTRITCRIIDVLPNRTLVLEGQSTTKTDDDETHMTLTGTCRSEDVGPDNTVLSTQLLNGQFVTEHRGAVRDSMRRGWLYYIWDKLRPF